MNCASSKASPDARTHGPSSAPARGTSTPILRRWSAVTPEIFQPRTGPSSAATARCSRQASARSAGTQVGDNGVDGSGTPASGG